jgi:hypothetical protein
MASPPLLQVLEIQRNVCRRNPCTWSLRAASFGLLKLVLFFTWFSDFDGPQTLWLPSGEGSGNTPQKKPRQIVCLNENPPSAVNTLIRLMCATSTFSPLESFHCLQRRGEEINIVAALIKWGKINNIINALKRHYPSGWNSVVDFSIFS